MKINVKSIASSVKGSVVSASESVQTKAQVISAAYTVKKALPDEVKDLMAQQRKAQEQQVVLMAQQIKAQRKAEKQDKFAQEFQDMYLKGVEVFGTQEVVAS